MGKRCRQEGQKKWKSGKKGKKEQCIRDGVLVRNNAQELARGTKNKKPPPKIVEKRPLPATRDKG